MKKILFKKNMIWATLEGLKTKTRRIISDEFVQKYADDFKEIYPQPNGEFFFPDPYYYDPKVNFNIGRWIMPKYKRGETVYVGEPFIKLEPNHIINNIRYYYKYDKNYTKTSEDSRQEYLKLGYPYKWGSPLFMPEVAARIFLKIKNVGVERIQDISEEDCLKEGIKIPIEWDLSDDFPEELTDFSTMKRIPKIKFAFKHLWDSINLKRGYPWCDNPYVFVYEYEIERIVK